MVEIGNVDLGNVESVSPTKTKTFKTITLPGEPGAYHQHLVSSTQTWRIVGHLNNPTQAEREAINNLMNGEVMLVDINAFSLFGYGKVRSVRWSVDNVFPDVYRYTLDVNMCPAIGLTHVHTDDVFLHDLDYRMDYKAFDPHFKKFNISYDANRFTATYEFYLDNDATSIQDAIIEIQIGDDISKFYLYHYNGSSWSVIGTWGSGATAWGGTISFNDAGTVGHNVIVNYGQRGSALTGIGTVSYKLGCKYRILALIGSLGTHTATDKYVDYSGDQLLLRVALEHSAAESGYRDYVKMTYIDGSLDYGPA